MQGVKGKKGKEGRKGKKELGKKTSINPNPKKSTHGKKPTDYKNTSINPNPKDPTYGEKGATYKLEKKNQKQRRLGHCHVHTQEPYILLHGCLA